MKIILSLLIILVLLVSFTYAGYCTIGEAECSDGENNDGDDGIDYFGYCSDLDCSYFKSAEECKNSCTGTYTEADSDCYSPLDTDESSAVMGAPAFAPEEEKGIFARFLDWIMFWD